MKLSDILKGIGIPSKEIKIRLSANRILINDEVVNQDVELGEFEVNDKGEPLIQDIGDFVFWLLTDHPKLAQDMKLLTSALGCNFENLIGSNIKNELTDYLNQFTIIRISKREAIVLKKKI